MNKPQEFTNNSIPPLKEVANSLLFMKIIIIKNNIYKFITAIY